jgi:hypothetical protein
MVFQFLCLGCAVSATSVNGFAPVLVGVRQMTGESMIRVEVRNNLAHPHNFELCGAASPHEVTIG